jgi:protein CpxP
MRRVRLITLGAIVAAVVAVGAAAHAQGPGPDGPRGRFRHFGPVDLPLRALELTDAQRQQVREITEKHRANLQTAGQQLRQAFAAQRAAIEKTPVDQAAIKSASDGLATAHAAMGVERAQIRSEVLSILTPEQQEKLKQLQAERETRMKERQDRLQKRRQPAQQG